MTESERFLANAERGRAPGLWLTLRLELGDRADEVAARFLTAMGTWITMSEAARATRGPDEEVWFEEGQEANWPSFEPSDNEAGWPTDDYLQALLPHWLYSHFDKPAKGATLAASDYPDYPSWLYVMRRRCWEWWGCKRDGHMLTVQLVVDGFPCPTGALTYLARAAGAVVVTTEE
jgi:hypothetical protein